MLPGVRTRVTFEGLLFALLVPGHRASASLVHPLLATTTIKALNLTGKAPAVALAKALSGRDARTNKQWPLRTGRECTSPQGIPQSPPPKDKKGCKWVAGQQSSVSLNYTAPLHKKTFGLMDPHKTEPPNSMVPKAADTTPTIILTRALFSQVWGGGGDALLGRWRGIAIKLRKCAGLYFVHTALSIFCSSQATGLARSGTLNPLRTCVAGAL